MRNEWISLRCEQVQIVLRDLSGLGDGCMLEVTGTREGKGTATRMQKENNFLNKKGALCQLVFTTLWLFEPKPKNVKPGDTQTICGPFLYRAVLHNPLDWKRRVFLCFHSGSKSQGASLSQFSRVFVASKWCHLGFLATLKDAEEGNENIYVYI